jgi:hypothetical protein
MPVTISEFVPLAGRSLEGYLEGATIARVATVNPKNVPSVTAEWFVYVDGRLYVPIDPNIADPGATTTPGSVHIENIKINPTIAGVIDQGESSADSRGVQFSGKATEVEDSDLIEELLDLVAAKYFYCGHPNLEHYFSPGLIKARKWYQVDEIELVGWDSRLLAQPPIYERRKFPASSK